MSGVYDLARKDVVFSVVIPTYNRDQLLRQALSSVLTQSFQQFEVIVVDNHSTDNTDDVIKSFNDPRISLLKIQNEGVIAKSRNLGIKKSSGNYIAFLDSDDYWAREKLARVFKVLEYDAQVGLICHDEYAVRNSSTIRRQRYGPLQNDMYRFLLLSGCHLSTSATVARKELLISVNGFSEDPLFAGVEDYDLWLRLSKECRFFFLHEPLGYFRIHEGAYTHSVKRHLDHSLHMLGSHFSQLIQNGNIQEVDIARRRAKEIRGAAHYLMHEGDHSGAAELLAMSIHEDPLSPKAWSLLVLNSLRMKL